MGENTPGVNVPVPDMYSGTIAISDRSFIYQWCVLHAVQLATTKAFGEHAAINRAAHHRSYTGSIGRRFQAAQTKNPKTAER